MAYTLEYIEAPSFNLQQGQMSATQRARITPYTSTAIQEYLEDTAGYVSLTGNTLTVTDPKTLPGFDYLVLQTISLRPFVPDLVSGSTTSGNNTSATNSSGGEITESYGTINADLAGDQDDEDLPEDSITGPNVEYSITARRELMTHSSWSLQWLNEDKHDKVIVPPDILPGLPISMIDINISWTDVPTPPWDDLFSMLGHMNDKKIFGFQKGEVLFTSFDANRKREPQTGRRVWDFNIVLTARRVPMDNDQWETADVDTTVPGWTHFLQPDPEIADAPWVRIVTKDEKKDIVSYADLNDLLKFPAN